MDNSFVISLHFNVFHLWLIIYIILTVICGIHCLDDYCLFDTFQAECPTNEIIMIREAQYGRMKKGRCVQDGSELGCSINAVPFLDKMCSGKSTCDYYVPGKALGETKPCKPGLQPYLEVAYICVQVAESDDSYSCAQKPFIELQGLDGYILSTHAKTKGWGSLQCPWKIKAMPGQSISVSLIDFSPHKEQQSCIPLGYISDLKFKNNVTICRSSSREQHIFTSNGNIVDIQITPESSEETNGFVLGYDIEGCADLLAPDHAWHKRAGNVATVGCEHQNKTWHLKCEGTKWDGVVGSCNASGGNIPTRDKNDIKWTFLPKDIPTEIMIIIIIVGITIIVAICIVTIIIRCRCMNRGQSSQEHPHFDANSIPPNYGYTSSQAHQKSSWACTFKGGQQMNTHIWESPLPEPQESEYTLPASMKKQLYPNNPESVQEGQTFPSNVSHSQMPHDLESDYTLPSNMRQTSQQGGLTSAQPHYTMPVKMKQHNNNMPTSTTSDYTIPVLPHPVPDTPDSESEYTVPTGLNVCGNQGDVTQESSLRRIL